MRMRLLVAVVLILCVGGVLTPAVAQKVVSIPQLQNVSLDSLLKLEALQNATTGIPLDKSAYWHGSGAAFNDDAKNDTVRVTGVVIVAPKVLTYTLARYNVFIQDSAGRVFGGLNVLTDDTTANAQATGINAIDTGMVVTITGRVKEYGSQNNSLTEVLAYSPGFYQTIVPVSIVGLWGNTGVRPQPVEITCDSLANLLKPKPSSAEKYEGMYVVIRNVTVNSVDVSSGRFTFKDAKGNQVQMYDGSAWYTLRGHKANNSKYSIPPVGTTLKYIRGVIIPQPRTGTCGDYCILPLYPGPKELTGTTYPGDIVVDKYGPTISNLRRTPTPPKSTDIVSITYKAYSPSVTTRKADSTFFNYRVGTQANRYGSGWVHSRIDSVAGDSVYRATIPAQANNALVSYFIEAYLDGVYSSSPDSSIPSFYVIKDAGYSIYDICYTPYANGLSGFAYDTVTVGGIITADTSDIKDLTTRGGRPNTPLLWLQGTNATWAGIQIWSPIDKLIDTLKRGDSVIVRGSVYGTSVRTQIAVTSLLSFKRGGTTIPAPTVRLMTSPQYFDYQLANPPVAGSSTFQPYMGMLLELQNMYIVYRNADNQTDGGSSNYGEFLISNVATSAPTTYGLRVNDNGVNRVYCDTNAAYQTSYNSTHPFTPGIKTRLIPFMSKLSYVRGILDYTNSNYKLEPRKEDDFGTVTSVYLDPSVVPQEFALEQNYPNPFNPTTMIRYNVPAKSRVTLTIYNILGQVVESLVDMDQPQGAYVVPFNATRLSTGVYFYELRAGDYQGIKKMLLLK
jgi:hypothetical protein